MISKKNNNLFIYLTVNNQVNSIEKYYKTNTYNFETIRECILSDVCKIFENDGSENEMSHSKNKVLQQKMMSAESYQTRVFK